MSLANSHKKAFNIIMVVAAALIVAVGVFAVFNLKGNAAQSENGASTVTITAKTGNVNIERGGIGYSLQQGDVLRDGDIIETLSGASATLQAEGAGRVVLDQNTEAVVRPAGESGSGSASSSGAALGADSASASGAAADPTFVLNAGSAFVTCDDAEKSVLAFRTAYGSYTAQDGVCAVAAHDGSDAVQVLAGTVREEAAQSSTESGRVIGAVVSTSGDSAVATFSETKLRWSDMSDFALRSAIEAAQSRTLCFSLDELQKTLDARSSISASATASAQALGADGTLNTSTAGDQSQDGAAALDGSAASDRAGTGSSAGGENQNGTSAAAGTAASGNSGVAISTCTIQIRCDTVLNNKGNLTAGKDAYVPANGSILAASAIQIADGDTIYDVLKAACAAAGLQLEYSWTPAYDSYYIEGINNLYEFDCGSGSGWIIRLNGWSIDQGVSKVSVSNGDFISIDYTCQYGEDL